MEESLRGLPAAEDVDDREPLLLLFRFLLLGNLTADWSHTVLLPSKSPCAEAFFGAESALRWVAKKDLYIFDRPKVSVSVQGSYSGEKAARPKDAARAENLARLESSLLRMTEPATLAM